MRLARRFILAALLLTAPAAMAQRFGPMPGYSSGEQAETTAGGDPIYIPDLGNLLPAARDKVSLSSSLQIVVLLTLLTVAPSIILMMTAFARIIVVLILLRQALGTQQLPPSQVLIGLALFMTFLVMAPTWTQIHEQAIRPYLDGEMEQLEAVERAGDAMRSFMFAQIRACGNEEDVYMLQEYALQRPVAPDEVFDEREISTAALIPAFLLSELKTAFLIGFRIYLPFLVIDMVISTVLVAMGMMMLPPVLISLPFKLLLFVLADGWHLVAGALLASVA